jgi:hypothetical protein
MAGGDVAGGASWAGRRRRLGERGGHRRPAATAAGRGGVWAGLWEAGLRRRRRVGRDRGEEKRARGNEPRARFPGGLKNLTSDGYAASRRT